LYGKVEAAAKLNDQVRANLLDGIPPNQSDFSDLDHAEQLVLAAYGSLRKGLADFLDQVQDVTVPDVSKGQLRDLWEEARGSIREEASLLAYAAFVRHQNNSSPLRSSRREMPRGVTRR
jgi:hypothetical protein